MGIAGVWCMERVWGIASVLTTVVFAYLGRAGWSLAQGVWAGEHSELLEGVHREFREYAREFQEWGSNAIRENLMSIFACIVMFTAW